MSVEFTGVPPKIKAKDMMSAASVAVHTTSRVRTAVEILRTLDVRHLPVVDDGGALVGLLGERDLRTLRIPYFIGNEYVGELSTLLGAEVSRLLGAAVPSVDTDSDLAEVVDLMIRHELGAVPVTDAQGVLVGIISYVDLLRTLSFAMASVD